MCEISAGVGVEKTRVSNASSVSAVGGRDALFAGLHRQKYARTVLLADVAVEVHDELPDHVGHGLVGPGYGGVTHGRLVPWDFTTKGEVLKGRRFADLLSVDATAASCPPCRDRYAHVGRWVVGVEGRSRKGETAGRRTSFTVSSSPSPPNPISGTLHIGRAFLAARQPTACPTELWRGKRQLRMAICRVGGAAAIGRRRGCSNFDAFTMSGGSKSRRPRLGGS